jgi:arylsulfatase A-like enzyme
LGKWHLCYDEKITETHGFETVDRRQKDAITADNVVEFLGQKQERPFLLVVSFLNPHNVCELARDEPLSNGPIGDPPPGAPLPSLPANFEPSSDEPDSMIQMRRGYHASPLFPVGDFTPERWRTLRWGYYRLIEKVDTEIGRVLTALRAAGLEENTVIVFTSDHGECAGAHRLNQKTVLYEESARVPLIISHPAQKAGRTSERLVNTGIDLLPTMLDYAGIPRSRKLSGLSLRPLVEGESVSAWRDQVIVQNNMSQAGLAGDFVPMTEGRMVRTERYKYCVYAHGERRESLVDLEEDPGEMVNLAYRPEFRNVLLEHRERLRQFGVEHNDALVTTLLADEVAPRPFARVTAPKNPRSAARPAARKK